MTTLLLEKYSDKWIKLISSNMSSRFVNVLRYSLKQNFRRWDPVSNTWIVHYSQINPLVKSARRHFEKVNYSQLPTQWQILAAGADIPIDLPDVKSKDWYSLLFVTDTAPVEVIKAAYKALSRKYHPDTGGSQEKMTQLNEAYNEINKLRKLT